MTDKMTEKEFELTHQLAADWANKFYVAVYDNGVRVSFGWEFDQALAMRCAVSMTPADALRLSKLLANVVGKSESARSTLT